MNHLFRKSLAIRILLFAALLAPEFAAAQRFGPWTKPRNLGPVINAAGYSTQHPAISKDGLSLYITTDRPGGVGGMDIWVSRRTSVDSEWQDPTPVPNINSEFNDGSPNITIDGHWMYFHSNRPTDCGGNWTATAPQADLYVSHRQDTHDDFGWEAPVNLGCMINTGFFDNGPTYFEDEASEVGLLYFTRLDDPAAKQKCGNANAGNYDIFVSTRNEDGIWGVAEPVCELSSLYRDTRTAIRRDGLEMFLSSGRPGGVVCPPSGRNEDIWVSTRPTTQAVWSTPVNIDQAQVEGDNYPVVNSCYFDGAPALSFDGSELYFFSERPFAPDGQPKYGIRDLYVTTRPKLGRPFGEAQVSLDGSGTAVTLASLSLKPTRVFGGTPSTGTVTLTSPAPTGGEVVSLSSSNPTVARVSSSVLVPAGATTAQFTVRTLPQYWDPGLAYISGTYGGVTKTAQLFVMCGSRTFPRCD